MFKNIISKIKDSFDPQNFKGDFSFALTEKEIREISKDKEEPE
jgi:hypothetical protein